MNSVIAGLGSGLCEPKNPLRCWELHPNSDRDETEGTALHRVRHNGDGKPLDETTDRGQNCTGTNTE